MNLPNKLTLLRVALVPVYLVLQAVGAHWVALAVFIIAALTDVADGQLARARGLVTNFGKFMDPIADKLLVILAAVLMTEQGLISAWTTIVWVAREFVVSGLRLVSVERGIVIAAGPWGKGKTLAQIVALCMLTGNLASLHTLTQIVLHTATALTILSGVLYVWNGRAVLAEPEEENS